MRASSGRNTIEPVDENRVRTREMSATSLNMDLPTQLLDSRISPQGFAIAHKTFKQFNPNEHNLVRGYTDATDEKTFALNCDEKNLECGRASGARKLCSR